MFGSRTRSVVTVTVIIEATIAGWVLGRPVEALLLMVLAVTAVDTLWGLLRRHALPREIGDQPVHEDRMPGVGYVSLSLQLHHASAGELRGQKAALEHLALVAVAPS